MLFFCKYVIFFLVNIPKDEKFYMVDEKHTILPSKFKISNPVESYDEKTAENDRNCYVTEKRIVSKQSKISIPNFNTTNARLE